MKGHRIGIYECAKCEGTFYVDDTFQFGGGFAPAAVTANDKHPLYWRGCR